MIRKPLYKLPRGRSYGSEHDEQVQVFAWARLMAVRFPEIDLMFAIPNGGHRHITVASRMKSEGVKAGVPDIFLPVARGVFHGLWIEMKRSGAAPKRGGKGHLSDKQIDWMSKLKDQGYAAEVCYGSVAAITVIEKYLTLPGHQVNA